jgi:hypothetical protein
MITFKLGQHSIRDSQVVEILGAGGILLGTIYPEESGIRLVSKYLDDDSVEMSTGFPPVLEVKLP